MERSRPTISSLHGMVAAAHPLAAQAGARLLRAGGNAFDAAAATAAALNVVEPYMSGLAGEGVAICHVAAEQRIRALDFVTRVPSALPVERLRMREDLARGPLCVGTPGSLAGWCELVRAYGSKTLREVFAPAIELAYDGFPLIEFNTAEINAGGARIKPHEALYDAWAGNYTGGTGTVTQGAILVQRDLARTYETIAAEGPGHLYGGALGRAIVARVRALGGTLNEDDLNSVRPEWLTPLAAGYRDVLVHTVPPPSEGFQFLLTLRILDGFDLARLERNSPALLDTVWRAIRLAAGVRIAHNHPTPEALMRLLGEEAVGALRRRVADGAPVDGPTEQTADPSPTEEDRRHTTSFSVADRAGNLVCVTQSLGSVFGSGIVVPGTGVCLNNFLYWGEVNPAGANHLRPGGKIALPIAPSISTRAGRPVLALGTPGSYGICQTQTQALVQYVDFGLGLQAAIAEPRARLMDGRSILVEDRFPTATIAALRDRGHAIEMIDAWSMKVGGMHGVAIDPATGAFTGGADPRRDGYAVPP